MTFTIEVFMNSTNILCWTGSKTVVKSSNIVEIGKHVHHYLYPAIKSITVKYFVHFSVLLSYQSCSWGRRCARSSHGRGFCNWAWSEFVVLWMPNVPLGESTCPNLAFTSNAIYQWDCATVGRWRHCQDRRLTFIFWLINLYGFWIFFYRKVT